MPPNTGPRDAAPRARGHPAPETRWSPARRLQQPQRAYTTRITGTIDGALHGAALLPRGAILHCFLISAARIPAGFNSQLAQELPGHRRHYLGQCCVRLFSCIWRTNIPTAILTGWGIHSSNFASFASSKISRVCTAPSSIRSFTPVLAAHVRPVARGLDPPCPPALETLRRRLSRRGQRLAWSFCAVSGQQPFVIRPAGKFIQVPSTAPFTEPSDPKTAPRLSLWLALSIAISISNLPASSHLHRTSWHDRSLPCCPPCLHTSP